MKPERASNEVMHFLQEAGYTCWPVNPAEAGKKIHGETVVASLKDLPAVPDMVDVFRNSDDALGVTEEAIAIGAKNVWLQLGVINEKAAEKAKEAGVFFIQNEWVPLSSEELDRFSDTLLYLQLSQDCF
jgi:predicted CoA-binding protein